MKNRQSSRLAEESRTHQARSAVAGDGAASAWQRRSASEAHCYKAPQVAAVPGLEGRIASYPVLGVI